MPSVVSAPLQVKHLHALRLVAELLHKGRVEAGHLYQFTIVHSLL